MSVNSDRREIAKKIACTNHSVTHFSMNRAEYLSGPIHALTAFCVIDIRKSGDEYVVDYDACLAELSDGEMDLEGLRRKISEEDYIWTLNTYPASFTLSTFTKNRQPDNELSKRICEFLVFHSVEAERALDFIENGTSDYLMKLRRFRSKELQQLQSTFSQNDSAS